jgi:hypothetical protein
MTVIEGINILDVEETLALLAATVAGREDYIYQRPTAGGDCNNVHRQGDEYVGGCLVGTLIVDRLGVDAQKIYEAEYHGTRINESDIYNTSVWLEENMNIAFTRKAISLLSSAQAYQDMGRPWGEVLEKAQRAQRAL